MNMPAEQMSSVKNLGTLLHGYVDAPGVDVSGIAVDSRLLQPGDLFLAIAGERSHGLDYLDTAVAAGVAAVAWDATTGRAPDTGTRIPLVAVPDLASRVGEIANRFYDRPCESLKVTGITGTNGKTTVAWLIAQCQELLGNRCGYIGTLGTGIGEIEESSGLTTPDAVQLIGWLAEFRNHLASHAAVEVSSHALAQDRVDGVEFETVIFTNLSRDHLDYHGDMRSYGEAKAKLFTSVPARHRIINLDSEFGAQLASRCGQDVVTVSTRFDRVANGRPFIFVRSVVSRGHGSELRVSTSWGGARFNLPLPGDFNVANAAMVLAQLLVDGVPLDRACDVLEHVSAPPGRMQRVSTATGIPAVYIDYAHTPAAVEAALQALKTPGKGKLWCVFGCGGDRDAGKRPLMARAAERFADHIVVTSDNPRRESPQAIIDQIVAGLSNSAAATVIQDRAAAIAWAIGKASPDDTILVAGKGHENYQIVGDTRLNFSDHAAAAANLAARAESDR